MSDRDQQRDAIDARIEQMARAYRDAHDGDDARAAATRAAILRQHSQQSSRQAWLMAALVLLAALVGLPTAWALYTGRIGAPTESDRGEPARPAPEPAPASDAEPVPEPAPVPVPASDAEPAPVPVPASEPEPASDSEPAPDSDSDSERAPTRATISELAPAAPEAEAASTSTGDDLEGVSPAERLAYDTAHALHFDRREAAGAVAAWDAYLEGYPHGRFALEAAYNRALALVRLGRNDEARAALTPFARGDHGRYRQRESAALLEALTDGTRDEAE